MMTYLILESMRSENESERQRMEEIFRERLFQVSQEFATELTNNNEELEARHKKKIGNTQTFDKHTRIFKNKILFEFSEQQFEKLMSEKEEIIQNLERQHNRKIIDSETKLR